MGLKEKLKCLASRAATPKARNNKGSVKEPNKASMKEGKSKTPTAKDAKNYDERMMKKYNLTKEQLKLAKQEAHQQRENWIKYKKEQVLDIFGSKNKYVSKSASSDVMHPKALRKVTTVCNKEGKEIPIEFGKRLEILLETHRPNTKFTIIKSHISTEKSKNAQASKFKQRHKIGNHKDRSKDKQAKYNQMKGSLDGRGGDTTGAMGSSNAADQSTNKEQEMNTNKSETDSKKAEEEDHVNTTDPTKKLFPKEWYALSSSRILVKKGRMIFWVAEEGEENQDFTENDEEQKFSVTTDVVLEVLENKREVRDTKLKDPGDGFGDMSQIHEDWQKTNTMSILFDNTLKGTVDFESKKPKDCKSKMDIGPQKIAWEPNCEVVVFKGETMKRAKVMKFSRKTETLQDIIRLPEE